MEPILTVAQMRKLDEYYINNVSSGCELMGKAGSALANEICDFKRIAIICGSGNNGGDGYATTYDLIRRENPPFEKIDIFYIKKPRSPESIFYFDNIDDDRVSVKQFSSKVDFENYDCIVDCLLGTGFSGMPSGDVAEAINKINSANCPFIVSMDINSGVNGDTGEGEIFVRSNLTLSLGYKKIGFLKDEFSKKAKILKNVNIGYDLSPDNLSPFSADEEILWVS